MREDFLENRIFKWALFVIFGIIILWITLHRSPGTERNADLRLFWAFREKLMGNPLWKKYVIQAIENIILFIPFGLLFPGQHIRHGVFIAFCLSVTIELSQWIFMLGYTEIDDVICNAAGAAIGLACREIVRKLKQIK